MGKKTLHFFPVCNSYQLTINTLKVAFLASKTWDKLETEGSSALQEVGRLLGRDKKEVYRAKLAGFGRRRHTGQDWQVFSSRGWLGDLCGRRP